MAINILESYEIGPIRPPSEAYSLFVRVTRNCPWNRCKFCHTYKDSKFEIRSIDEIIHDINVAKKYYDVIKENAFKSGYADDIKTAAGIMLGNAPDEAYLVGEAVHDRALPRPSGIAHSFARCFDSIGS